MKSHNLQAEVRTDLERGDIDGYEDVAKDEGIDRIDRLSEPADGSRAVSQLREFPRSMWETYVGRGLSPITLSSNQGPLCAPKRFSCCEKGSSFRLASLAPTSPCPRFSSLFFRIIFFSCAPSPSIVRDDLGIKC